MKFQSLEIKDMTNDQLKKASQIVLDMAAYRDKQLASKKERHDKFEFDYVNPTFKQVVSEIEQELRNRKIVV